MKGTRTFGLWQVIWILCPLIVLFAGKAGFSAEDTLSQELPSPKVENMVFYLQRDPDANTVVYQLNFEKDGALQRDNPVKGSWIRYSEKGQLKELNPIEKRLAYGLQSKYLGNDTFELKFVSYKKTSLYLMKDAARQYRVFTSPDKTEVLKRVFVKVNGGSFLAPNVEYLELFCTDLATGKEIVKKIKV
ncbi:MAG TPA: DUF4833 domain-containing protein [Sphingobacteriaceae bacterium]